MKNLIEHRIADALRSRLLNERQGQRFPQHRKVSFLEEFQSRPRHDVKILRNPSGIISGIRPVRPRNEDEELIGHIFQG